MTSTLSQSDVSNLLAEPSPRVRSELAGKLAVELDSPKLTAQELQLAQDIVRVMAKDVEATVRQALSHSLRRAHRLPHDVALKLANDVESVALPILQNSSVLTDDDLTEIIRGGAAAKHEAIASRPNVSEKVSDVLISTAGERAVAVLMNNQTARISEVGFEKAVDRFSGSTVVKEKMVTRTSLPAVIAERLVTLVSENLRDYLVSHHEMSPAIAANLVLQSRERATMNLSGRSSEAELEQMVVQMYRSKRLTPSIVIRALCLGDMGFFEMAMAVMASIPVINSRKLIHDPGKTGLKALYQKTGLPQELLPAVAVAIDVVHETEIDGSENGRERFQARVIERVLTQFEAFAPADLDYLLDKLGDVLGTSPAAA